MEIYTASNQWATRPPDERFWTLEELRRACEAYAKIAVESTVTYGDLRVEALDQDLVLTGKTGHKAKIGHYAFGQLAARTKSPAGYLRSLPPTLAAQNLNHGLKGMDPTDSARLLMHRSNGDLMLRAATSEQYSRIWNFEVADMLAKILPDWWRSPPARPAPSDPRARPATEDDCLRNRSSMLSIQPGDMIGPAGLYASDKDLFLFLVDEDRIIDDGTDDGIARGIMIWNSEVGDMSFGGLSFHYKHVCGNHIVWGASDVTEFRFYHVGEARKRSFHKLLVDFRQYADSSSKDVEAQIKIAKQKETDLESVLEFVGKKRILGINKSNVTKAIDIAEQHRDWYRCPPNSVYGIVSGLTEMSQETKYTDERVKLDKAAGKLMEMAF